MLIVLKALNAHFVVDKDGTLMDKTFIKVLFLFAAKCVFCADQINYQ